MNLDFGPNSLGTSSVRNVTLPLTLLIRDVRPDIVLYQGGNNTIDPALALAGLGAPLTAGKLATKFPTLQLRYSIVGVPTSGSDFTASPGNCVGSTAVSCDASIYRALVHLRFRRWRCRGAHWELDGTVRPPVLPRMSVGIDGVQFSAFGAPSRSRPVHPRSSR